MKFEHILLTTDLSDESTRAFEPMRRLAAASGAKITLLFVAKPADGTLGASIDLPVLPTDPEEVEKAARLQMERLASSKLSGVVVEHEVARGGDVAAEIIGAAERGGADLIALSTHGRSGIRRMVLGSVAEQVIRRSPVPVMSFPWREIGEHGGLQHMLLTTDLSEDALRPLEPLVALAKERGARVSVVHVVSALEAIPYGAPMAPRVSNPALPEEMARARAAVEEQCGSICSQVHVDVVADEEPAKAIVEYAVEHNVDLIAISSHGRTGFRRMAFGSVAEQVLRTSSVPVLSFHRT